MGSRLRHRITSRLAPLALVAAVALTACKGRNKTGELSPPNDAPAWENRYAVAFDDGYTREEVALQGRAPNDVLDQRLFQARLGHSALALLVEVKQVWGRGRYQGRQDQYLEVTLGRELLGELPRKTAKTQLLRVDGPDELPGNLQGQTMVLFIRWAPGERPPFHHHLMPATDELVEWIDAMVAHARSQGALRTGGEETKRARRKRERKARKAAKAPPAKTAPTQPKAP